MSATASNVHAEAARAARSKPMEVLARLGLATRGVLYLLIALIVVDLVRSRGTEEDQASNTGALEKIVEQPFGRFLLTLVAIGVAGYALWRFAEAWLRREDKPIERARQPRPRHRVRRSVHRRPSASSPPSRRGTDGSGEQQVDTILDWPAGRWIVGAIALGVFAIAVDNLVRAVTGKWREHLDLGHLSRPVPQGRRGRRLGRADRSDDRLRARRMVPPPCRHRSSTRASPWASTSRCATWPIESWGPLLLIVTAIGLAAYGLFSFVEARWRRMSPRPATAARRRRRPDLGPTLAEERR